MTRPIAEKLQNKPILEGPLSNFRGNFRSRLGESIITGRLQSELVLGTLKSVGRTLTSSVIDAGVKPFVENRIKRRFER